MSEKPWEPSHGGRPPERSAECAETIFSIQFLQHLHGRDEEGEKGARHLEADFAGPWSVANNGGVFTLTRQAEGAPGPVDASFHQRETALLAAAVYPTLGQKSPYALTYEKAGYTIQGVVDGKIENIGWLRHEQPELLRALNVAEWLLSSPASLALFLDNASYSSLAQAAMILSRRLRERRRE